MTTEQKTERLNLRMSAEDRAYTEALTEALGQSDMSCLVRYLVRTKCRELGVEPKPGGRAKRKRKGG